MTVTSSPPQSPTPPPSPTPRWWPILTSLVGLAAFIYEVGFDPHDRPWIITGAVGLALGGKVAEKIIK